MPSLLEGVSTSLDDFGKRKLSSRHYSRFHERRDTPLLYIPFTSMVESDPTGQIDNGFRVSDKASSNCSFVQKITRVQ